MKLNVTLNIPAATGTQNIFATVDWPDENFLMPAGIMRYDVWAKAVGIGTTARFAWI
jgi:hypothetical protein